MKAAMTAMSLSLWLVPAMASARPLIGDPAPQLSLVALSGRPAQLRPGRVTIVDFSATWCGPCHAALTALTLIATRMPEVDLVIVDVGEPRATVAQFYGARTLPPSATVLVDEDASAAARWGHDRFPTTFLVDRDGAIRFINRGYGPGYAARIAERLRALTPPDK